MREWAPRDSLRASADTTVASAQLELAPDGRHRLALSLALPARQPRQRPLHAVAPRGPVVAVLLQVLDHAVGGGAPENQDVEQRVAAQTVGPVHRDAGALARGVQARHRLLGAVALRHHHLAVAVGGDAAHGVVGGRIDRDRLLDGIEVQEGQAHVADAGQAAGAPRWRCPAPPPPARSPRRRAPGRWRSTRRRNACARGCSAGRACGGWRGPCGRPPRRCARPARRRSSGSARRRGAGRCARRPAARRGRRNARARRPRAARPGTCTRWRPGRRGSRCP